MSTDNFREKDYYKQKIIEMVEKIEDTSFLNKIWTIITIHMEKGGN